MGQRSSGPIGFDIFGIGMTVALFHSVGKVDISIEVLMILRSRSEQATGVSICV